MKKLFLTSGLILCMACPALAYNDIDPNGKDATNTEVTANCTETYLGTAEDTAYLEAIWDPVSYTISFAGGTAGTRTVTGSTAAITPVTFDSAAFNLTANGFSVTGGGYTFDHWASTYDLETGDETATEYDDEEQISPYRHAGNITLTAVWEPIDYTVTYDKGAHSSSANATDTATFDTAYTALAYGTPGAGMTADNGWTFAGWTTDSTPTFTNNTLDNEFTGIPAVWNRAAGNFTVYAAYTANSYSITFTCGTKPAGASASSITGSAPSSQSVTYGSAYAALPATAGTCALTGWHFNGWDCDNGILAAGDTAYNVVGSSECRATWTQNSITLNWNDNGATSAHVGGDATCTYDGSITIPTTDPQKTGYTFQGWSVVGD